MSTTAAKAATARKAGIFGLNGKRVRTGASDDERARFELNTTISAEIHAVAAFPGAHGVEAQLYKGRGLDLRRKHICCAAHGGLVGHRPVTPHTPGCYVGAGCSAWARAVQVRCLSLEVLCERCAVHGAARCGGGTLRLARGRARDTRVWPTRPASACGFVVHCCWMRLALAVQLVLRYSGVSPGSRTRVRRARRQ